MTTEVKPTMADLQAKLAAAFASSDTAAIEDIAAEIVKGKAERRKAEAEAIIKEAEAMAGDREGLGKDIHAWLVNPKNKLAERLGKVKAQGFTFKLDEVNLDANGVDSGTKYAAVQLLVPGVPTRTKKAGGTGGGGKSKVEYGMALDAIYEQFATPEERAKLAEAKGKDEKYAQEHGLKMAPQSRRWAVKNEVKKRALKEGLLAPAK